MNQIKIMHIDRVFGQQNKELSKESLQAKLSDAHRKIFGNNP
jgi:hypothetical protein